MARPELSQNQMRKKHLVEIRLWMNRHKIWLMPERQQPVQIMRLISTITSRMTITWIISQQIIITKTTMQLITRTIMPMYWNPEKKRLQMVEMERQHLPKHRRVANKKKMQNLPEQEVHLQIRHRLCPLSRVRRMVVTKWGRLDIIKLEMMHSMVFLQEEMPA